MIYLQLLYTYTQRILIKIETALSLEFILKCVFEKLRSRAMSHFVLNTTSNFFNLVQNRYTKHVTLRRMSN